MKKPALLALCVAVLLSGCLGFLHGGTSPSPSGSPTPPAQAYGDFQVAVTASGASAGGIALSLSNFSIVVAGKRVQLSGEAAPSLSDLSSSGSALLVASGGVPVGADSSSPLPSGVVALPYVSAGTLDEISFNEVPSQPQGGAVFTPSEQVRLPVQYTVNGRLIVLLNFLADKSLHGTNTGQQAFLPVISVRFLGGEVPIASGSKFSASLFENASSIWTAGMNEKGEMVAGYALPPQIKIILSTPQSSPSPSCTPDRLCPPIACIQGMALNSCCVCAPIGSSTGQSAAVDTTPPKIPLQ